MIGLSFGGLIAVEVAKLIETEKVILIASAKTEMEIPPYYRMFGRIKLNRILPTKILKMANPLSFWLFGAQSQADRKMLTEILKDTDAKFLKWAIEIIITWKNRIVHQNLVHIHGTKDRILPVIFVDTTIKVKDGGHLMTLNKADELMETISSIIWS